MVNLYNNQLPEGTEKYREGLGAIDAVFQTSNLAAYDNQKAMEALILQYQRTGDVAGFEKGMQDLADKGMKAATEQLEAAAKQAEELYRQLMNLPESMVLNIRVNVEGMPDLSTITVQQSYAGTGDYKPVDIEEPKADGGPVYANHGYWVGEEGPEPYIPAQNGRILSVEEAQAALAGKNDGQLVQYVDQISVLIERVDSVESADAYARQTAREIQWRRR
jgi:hypothetical protein